MQRVIVAANVVTDDRRVHLPLELTIDHPRSLADTVKEVLRQRPASCKDVVIDVVRLAIARTAPERNRVRQLLVVAHR